VDLIEILNAQNEAKISTVTEWPQCICFSFVVAAKYDASG